MRVLMINKFLYPRGGDAIVTLNTGSLLEGYGHEVVYWGMKNSQNHSFLHEDFFIDEVDLNAGGGVGHQLRIAGNMLYSLEAKRKVQALITHAGKPDIVHLHNFAHQISPSILHIFRKYNIPCVMTMHDYKIVCAAYTLFAQGKLCEKCSNGAHINCFFETCVKSSKVKSLLNSMEMYLHHSILRIYNFIDIFISPSTFLKEKVCAMGFKKPVEVLPNFIDISNYDPEYTVQGKTICYIGRLSKEKGIATLINAVKNLEGVQLKIIGDGPLRNELEEGVHLRGVNNVSFLGYLSTEELKEEIRRCQFTVTPSQWYENNPRSIIESFALGKPVIGARIGGIPELVRDGETGFTFEHGNAKDLAEKISMLISNPTLCAVIGKCARRWVEEQINSNIHYERLIEIYQQAIGSRQFL